MAPPSTHKAKLVENPSKDQVVLGKMGKHPEQPCLISDPTDYGQRKAPKKDVFVYWFGAKLSECWGYIPKTSCKVWDDDSRAAYEEKTLDAKIKQTILDDLAKWEKDGTRALRIRTNG